MSHGDLGRGSPLDIDRRGADLSVPPRRPATKPSLQSPLLEDSGSMHVSASVFKAYDFRGIVG